MRSANLDMPVGNKSCDRHEKIKLTLIALQHVPSPSIVFSCRSREGDPVANQHGPPWMTITCGFCRPVRDVIRQSEGVVGNSSIIVEKRRTGDMSEGPGQRQGSVQRTSEVPPSSAQRQLANPVIGGTSWVAVKATENPWRAMYCVGAPCAEVHGSSS